MSDFSDKFSNLVLIFGPDSVVMSDIESKLAQITVDHDTFPAGVFHLGVVDKTNVKGYVRSTNDTVYLPNAVLIDVDPHPLGAVRAGNIAEFIIDCGDRGTQPVWIGCVINGLECLENKGISLEANNEVVLTFLQNMGYKG